MFNPNLCIRPSTLWTDFNYWWQLNWLTKPLLVLLLLLAFLGVYRISQHSRWRRWLSSPSGFCSLIGFTVSLLLLSAVAAKGLVAFLPTDSGATVDVIVVLGRGEKFSPERTDLAAQLWQAKRAPRIFASGRGDTPRLIERLQAKGIPSQVLDGENCSLSTIENAQFTAAILQTQAIQRILLITDGPHMLRSLLVFRALGFTVIPRKAAIPTYWGFTGKALLTFREYSGLLSYSVRGLFRPQPSPALNNSDILNLIQSAEQYGQQQRLN